MPTKEIVDFGEKIGGARKDLRGNVRPEDIRRMTPEERLELVTKDMVWPTPPYAELVNEQGYTQRAALLIKSLRDAFPAAPQCGPKATEEQRTQAAEMYAQMVNAARAVAGRGKSEAELSRAMTESPEAKEWLADLSIPAVAPGAYARVEYKPAARFNEAVTAAFGSNSYSESRDLLTVFRTFATGKPDHTTERILRRNPQWPNGTTQAEAYLRRYHVEAVPVDTQGFRIGRAGRVANKESYDCSRLMELGFDEASLETLYPTRGEAEAAMVVVAEAYYATARAEAKTKRDALVRRAKGVTVPGDALVERVGKNWRDGADVSGNDYLTVFGLRGGEFGLWVNQDERQAVLNKGFDSFHDLADVLGLQPSHISFGGELAIAFGARGQGGSAAAHYEPGRKVINLTKPSGEGCLAHEIGHALDHHVGRRAGELGLIDHVRDPQHATYLTNCTLKKPVEGVVESPEATFLRDLHAAMDSVATNTDPETKEEAMEQAKVRLDAHLRSAMISAGYAERFIQHTPGLDPARRNELLGCVARMRSPDPKEPEESFDGGLNALVSAPELSRFAHRHYLSESQTQLGRARFSAREIAALPADWKGPQRTRKTAYSGACAKLDAERTNPYYSKNHEMFARAFEAVVADELAAGGRGNFFLVAGAAGEAFPQGRERDRLRSKFTPLLRQLAEHLPRVDVHATRRKLPPLPQPMAASIGPRGEQMNLL